MHSNNFFIIIAAMHTRMPEYKKKRVFHLNFLFPTGQRVTVKWAKKAAAAARKRAFTFWLWFGFNLKKKRNTHRKNVHREMSIFMNWMKIKAAHPTDECFKQQPEFYFIYIKKKHRERYKFNDSYSFFSSTLSLCWF